MDSSTLYIQHLLQLLQMEYDSEKESFRIQSEKMGVKRKIRRGICWFPVVTTRSYYNSLNQLVVEIVKKDHHETDDDIEHLFEYGKPVQFFSTTPTISVQGATSEKRFQEETSNNIDEQTAQIKYFPFSSTVSFAEEGRMVVTIPSSQALIDLQSTPLLGVQLYFDETSYKSMFHALDDVLKAKDNRLADLRDIFAGLHQPQKYSFSALSFPWLNKTQEQAVNEVLWAKDVEVIHGPPGTGKTTTLVEAIYETLHRETQVLVCAQSNMAVDWISEKLVDHGVLVLRIGNPSRVNDKMLSFTYERKFESHPDYPELWSIRKTIRQIKENRKKGDSVHQKIARLRDRATEIEVAINASLFNEARVIACTLVGSANKILFRHKFSTLFIDEAAQALEPACWIALRKASRVILAGDHQQLPPTVKCYDAMKQGLGRTLMERIVDNQPKAVSLLKVQYRMNDAIMKFSSDWFYHGEVQSDESVKYRSVLDWENPIQWVDGKEILHEVNTELEKKGLSDERMEIDFTEQFVGENHGRINKAEAELVLSTLQRYIIDKIGLARFLEERLDVGIISPYKVQTQYLRQQIRKREEFRAFRHVVSVNTVDGFQGQERDIIMISLVRSNENAQIGFLSDLRRMNVAMTRARMKLFVFGDKTTLQHHTFYRRLIQYIEEIKAGDNKRSEAPRLSSN